VCVCGWVGGWVGGSNFRGVSEWSCRGVYSSGVYQTGEGAVVAFIRAEFIKAENSQLQDTVEIVNAVQMASQVL
jgi:hypothetical protein